MWVSWAGFRLGNLYFQPPNCAKTSGFRVLYQVFVSVKGGEILSGQTKCFLGIILHWSEFTRAYNFFLSFASVMAVACFHCEAVFTGVGQPLAVVCILQSVWQWGIPHLC